MYAHAVSNKKIIALRRLLLAGHSTVPAPAAKMHVSGQQEAKADAWFQSLYDSLAEPLAIDDVTVGEDEVYAACENEQHPLWTRSMLASQDGKHVVFKRYLSPGNFEDLWRLYQIDNPVDAVSYSTIYRSWTET
eukprot:10765205-Karenia_brevis.AAC.2